jgi:hypothetical protein
MPIALLLQRIIFKTHKVMLHDLPSQTSTLTTQTNLSVNYFLGFQLYSLYEVVLDFPKHCRLIGFGRNASFYNAAERIPSSTQRGSSPSSSNKERAAKP